MKGDGSVIDFLVHGGHQYEFFKSNRMFYCTYPNGSRPNWSDLGRPKNKGVDYLDGSKILSKISDKNLRPSFIMVRSGVKKDIYDQYRARNPGLMGIAVMQTTSPFRPPDWVRHIVWNSEVSMMRHRGLFPGRKHFYIPHGFDPLEFKYKRARRNGRMLSCSSHFAQRGDILGYKDWAWVSSAVGGSALLGHGNGGIDESAGSLSLNKLVAAYNSYSVYLNTTVHSAMPRARAEAMMCGMPMVTTNNYGIDRYLKHKRNCFFADTKEDMLKYVKRFLGSKAMQIDYGEAAKEVAIQYFHIKDYLERWDHVFKSAWRTRGL